MHLLVSTPLQIFLIDTTSGLSTILRAGDGYYFGITCKGETVVLSHSGGYLQYFNKETKPITSVNHLIQPHQIEWVEDKILVTNTGKNCLSVFDNKGNLCRDVYLNQIRWDDKNGERIGNHFNSVHRIKDRVFVVAHNYERPSEVWELTWPELDVVDKAVCRASWAHNLWSCEWGMVVCNSKHGSLYEVSSGETIWQSNKEAVMTRGLAASEDYVFVGYSTYAERKERYWKTGGVSIIDRKTLKTIANIPLPGSGDVQEIRLIGVPDECHNDQVITHDKLLSINRVSPFIALAYKLRKTFPLFQQNLFPISHMVRAAQMAVRWEGYKKKLPGDLG